MKNKPILVIALDGNALLKRGEPLKAEIQRENIDPVVKTITQLTQYWQVVLIHGNGPQVGLLALQNSAYARVTPYPLDILGAGSQGMIGYTLQQALENQLPQREISVLLTQVEVDTNDPALSNPTEYIGPIYGHAQAQVLQVEEDWIFKTDGHSFRRVIPSPQPRRIVERDAIQALIAHDHLVICNDGGGVPVVEKADGYHGVEAVIDKGLSTALLTNQIHTGALLILIDADMVYLDWDKPTQRPLAQVTPGLLNEMQFNAGSMGPKVTACAKFISQRRGIAGVDSLADGPGILAGDKGTLARLDTPIATLDPFLQGRLHGYFTEKP